VKEPLYHVFTAPPHSPPALYLSHVASIQALPAVITTHAPSPLISPGARPEQGFFGKAVFSQTEDAVSDRALFALFFPQR